MGDSLQGVHCAFPACRMLVSLDLFFITSLGRRASTRESNIDRAEFLFFMEMKHLFVFAQHWKLKSILNLKVLILLPSQGYSRKSDWMVSWEDYFVRRIKYLNPLTMVRTSINAVHAR